MDQYVDFVAELSRGVNYFMHNDRNHQIKIFSLAIEFKPKEETSRAAVWISFSNLSMNLFAKRSLLFVASTVEKCILVDKATQVRSRPSTARVRVILDLMDKHPDLIRLQSVDKVITDNIIEEFQKPLIATLDASACEIPSPSMESIVEKWNEFEHKLLFKGNEQDVNGVVVLTLAYSNNKVEAKSDQNSGTNIKSWTDMTEEEKQAPSPPTCSKLSPAAAEFVPSYAMVLPFVAAE
ncbi:hypothetical protein CQW23_05464 [Capsicum baccatum]|uniref:Uncharacterized protein n=1 Tax=Capsicum baccatum TaxID=33114 RepID=A0A2G2XHL4_CAPBA|nr:hypothetical protein CQW23_05464 [Capsicum baccatum]